jgi:transcriptional regulator with XRE-family HTH domain
VDNGEQKLTFQPTAQQLEFAELWLDYTQKLTLEQIAEKLGCSRTAIWKWHQNKDFINWLNEKSDKMLRSALSRIHKSLIRKAELGDVSAIKLYLENLGEFVAKSEITVGWKE